MDISKAEVVLKDLIESTSRMDGRPLQFTAEEYAEAHAEFVKHVNAARIGYEDLRRLAKNSAKIAKDAKIAVSKLIDVASMYPVGIAEKVNCKDVNCIYPVTSAEDTVKLKNMNGKTVATLNKGGNEDGLHEDK